MNDAMKEVGTAVAKKLAGLDVARRAVMTKHTALIASQVRRGARWQQDTWLRAACGAPPDEAAATDGEGAVGNREEVPVNGDEESDGMFNVGDVTTIYNFPSETKERIEKTHTTDAKAIASAVDTVAGSPLGKWGRRMLYTAIGASLAGNVIAIPTAMYAALKGPAQPASASATVNVPPAADTDTDTTTEYELRIRPNPVEPGASDATNY